MEEHSSNHIRDFSFVSLCALRGRQAHSSLLELIQAPRLPQKDGQEIEEIVAGDGTMLTNR